MVDVSVPSFSAKFYILNLQFTYDLLWQHQNVQAWQQHSFSSLMRCRNHYFMFPGIVELHSYQGTSSTFNACVRTTFRVHWGSSGYFPNCILHTLKSMANVISKSSFFISFQWPKFWYILDLGWQIWKIFQRFNWIKNLQYIKNWGWLSKVWFHNFLFHSPSTLYSGFEPIPWRFLVFICSLLSDLHCSPLNFLWSNELLEKVVPLGYWSGVCAPPKFVIWVWVRDDLTASLKLSEWVFKPPGMRNCVLQVSHQYVWWKVSSGHWSSMFSCSSLLLV